MYFRLAICLAASLLGLAGCGGQAVIVRGTVTLDGGTLADGKISFVPQDGTGTAIGASIKDGEYQLTGLSPGKYRVQISVIKLIEIPKDDPIYGRSQTGPIPMGEMLPPEALNGKDVVTVNAGSQVIDFEAKTKRK